MNDILSGISAIPGVLGSVVFARSGQCLGSLLVPPYEPVLFTQFFAQLRSAEEIFAQLSSQPINIAVLRFDGGYLYLRGLGDAFLAVLAQASVNISMVSVGCNVAVLKIEAAINAAINAPNPPLSTPGTISSRFPSLGVQEPPAVISSQFPVAPRSGDSQNKMNTSPSKAAGWSGSGTISLSKSGMDSPSLNADAPPDAVGRPVVESVLKALARQLGPFAKVHIKEALTRLGVSASTLGLSQYNDFIGLLAERISEPPRAKAFLAEATALLPKK